MDILKADLFKNYDVNIRPANFNETTYLKVGLNVHRVEIDDSESLVTTHSWIEMSWNDNKLKWDPAKYNNVNMLRMSKKEVWMPDFTSYNSGGLTVFHEKNQVIVSSNGNILWVSCT